MNRAAATAAGGMGPARRRGFTALLMLAMGLSTFTSSVIGIIASSLIDEFDLTRRDIGTIVAVNTVAGGLLSPLAGRAADRLGGVRAVVAVFVLAGLGLGTAAISPWYGLLLVAGLFGGAAQAGTNPSTNKAIATHIPVGGRAAIIGLKQSGVQIAIFLGGLIVPVVAEEFGWRVALGGAAALAALAVPIVLGVFPSDEAATRGGHGGPSGRVPSSMWWLAGYGFLVGSAVATTLFIPLFAEEALGLSVRIGGVAVAVVGLSSVVGRLAWALWAEGGARHVTALSAIALLGVAMASLMLLAPRFGSLWMWLGLVVMGLGLSSWNSVGMLTVVDIVGPDVAGRASGRVLFGFLIGLGGAPAVYGQTVDSTGSYDAMWTISLVIAAMAFVLTLVWRRRVTP